MSESTDFGLIYYICSMTTTLICIILKFPQVSLLYSSKSAQGISMSSLLLEFWA